MSDPKFLALLGEKIRHLRLKKKLRQNELSILCNFEKASMSRIESGKTNITILTLKKICTALEIDVSEFFRN